MFTVLLVLIFLIQFSGSDIHFEHDHELEYGLAEVDAIEMQGRQCAKVKLPLSGKHAAKFLTTHASESTINLSINYHQQTSKGKRRNFLNYVIHSDYSHSLDCPNLKRSENQTISIPANMDNVEIKNLLPGTCYKIFVCSTSVPSAEYPNLVNLKAIAKSTYCTKQSTQLISSVYPEIKHTVDKQNRLVLSAMMSCHLIEEEESKMVLLLVNISCKEIWCNHKKMQENEMSWNFQKNRVFRQDLQAYSHYIISVNFTNTVKNQNQNVYNVAFRTYESVPSPISKIEITSKNDSSVSLRWLPPYPPNGVLEDYKIFYGEHSLKTKPAPCKLWPSFHCATISDSKIFQTGRSYTFSIFGKNENVPSYSLNSTTISTTINNTTAPEPPFDLQVQWKNDEDTMSIYWKHPNNTNGALAYFSINLSIPNGTDDIYRNDYKINSENDYKFLYQMEIHYPKIQKCTEYSLVLNSHNKNGLSSKSDEIIRFYSAPPQLPQFLNNNNIRVHPTKNSIEIYFSSPKVFKNCTLIKTQTIIYCLANESLKFNQTLLDQINQKFNASSAIENCLVVYAGRGEEDNFEFTIGDGFETTSSSYSNFLNLEIGNPIKSLASGTSYTITAILIYEYKNNFRMKYKTEIITVETLSSFNALYLSPLLLIIILVTIIIFRKKFNICKTKHQTQPAANPSFQSLKHEYITLVDRNRKSHIYETIDEAAHFYEIPREPLKETIYL